jgi:hypothetical protein
LVVLNDVQFDWCKVIDDVGKKKEVLKDFFNRMMDYAQTYFSVSLFFCW